MTKIERFLKDELTKAVIERTKAEEALVNVIVNCGKNDIAVEEYVKTIKYYRNRIVELKELMNEKL